MGITSSSVKEGYSSPLDLIQYGAAIGQGLGQLGSFIENQRQNDVNNQLEVLKYNMTKYPNYIQDNPEMVKKLLGRMYNINEGDPKINQAYDQWASSIKSPEDLMKIYTSVGYQIRNNGGGTPPTGAITPDQALPPKEPPVSPVAPVTGKVSEVSTTSRLPTRNEFVQKTVVSGLKKQVDFTNPNEALKSKTENDALYLYFLQQNKQSGISWDQFEANLVKDQYGTTQKALTMYKKLQADPNGEKIINDFMPEDLKKLNAQETENEIRKARGGQPIPLPSMTTTTQITRDATIGNISESNGETIFKPTTTLKNADRDSVLKNIGGFMNDKPIYGDTPEDLNKLEDYLYSLNKSKLISKYGNEKSAHDAFYGKDSSGKPKWMSDGLELLVKEPVAMTGKDIAMLEKSKVSPATEKGIEKTETSINKNLETINKGMENPNYISSEQFKKESDLILKEIGVYGRLLGDPKAKGFEERYKALTDHHERVVNQMGGWKTLQASADPQALERARLLVGIEQFAETMKLNKAELEEKTRQFNVSAGLEQQKLEMQWASALLSSQGEGNDALTKVMTTYTKILDDYKTRRTKEVGGRENWKEGNWIAEDDGYKKLWNQYIYAWGMAKGLTQPEITASMKKVDLETWKGILPTGKGDVSTMILPEMAEILGLDSSNIPSAEETEIPESEAMKKVRSEVLSGVAR